MTDLEQKNIFSKNLNDLLKKRNKTQKEVAEAIGVSPQTFNTWCQAIALPRMGKVQRLADYFHVPKSVLIDPPVSKQSPVVLDQDQEKLLFFFNQLNAAGRAAALERIEEMTQNKKFIATPSSEKMA